MKKYFAFSISSYLIFIATLQLFSLTCLAQPTKRNIFFLKFYFRQKGWFFLSTFCTVCLWTVFKNEYNKTQSYTFSASFPYDYVLFSQTREKKSFLSLLLTFSAPDRLLLLSVSSLTACVRKKIWFGISQILLFSFKRFSS